MTRTRRRTPGDLAHRPGMFQQQNDTGRRWRQAEPAGCLLDVVADVDGGTQQSVETVDPVGACP